MYKALTVSLVSVVLLSCTGTDQETFARDSAKQVLRPIAQQKFPNLPTDVIVDCAVDNSSISELSKLGVSVATGQTADTASTAASMLGKPDVLKCAANKGLEGILGTKLS